MRKAIAIVIARRNEETEKQNEKSLEKERKGETKSEKRKEKKKRNQTKKIFFFLRRVSVPSPRSP